MALFILFCDVTAELTNQELRFGLKIPLVVIANGAQNSNLSKIFATIIAIMLPIIPIIIANNEFTELHAAVIATNPARGPRTI